MHVFQRGEMNVNRPIYNFDGEIMRKRALGRSERKWETYRKKL
jgi:hypothetical protein